MLRWFLLRGAGGPSCGSRGFDRLGGSNSAGDQKGEAGGLAESKLGRFTLASFALFVLVMVIGLISLLTCSADGSCPKWRVWLNATTIVGAFALLLLAAIGAVALLSKHSSRY